MRAVRLLVMVAAILAAGCASGARAPGGLAGAPAPIAAIEQFLQHAAGRDYASMGWVFGTAEGPIAQRDPLPEVEQRMYVLADVLAHDGFVIAGGSAVPGRTGSAMTFDVTLRRGGRTFQVPFTAVRGPSDRWYVEQFAVEAITGAPMGNARCITVTAVSYAGGSAGVLGQLDEDSVRRTRVKERDQVAPGPRSRGSID